jgi:predicted nucleic-acid-binding Zn-ribbon protein
MKKQDLVAKYFKQENLIVCDNPNCDYKVVNTGKNSFQDISKYINKPCPKCGCNLLTEKDYLTGLQLEKIINFVDKWFSWLTIFSKKTKMKKGNIKIKDNKVNIEMEDDE